MEFDEIFWSSMRKLAPGYRDVAMMLLEDTPYAEMAQPPGCSEDTLRVKVSRIRRALLKIGIAA